MTAQVRPSPRWGWAEGFPPATGGLPLKSGQAGLTGERSAGRDHRAQRHERRQTAANGEQCGTEPCVGRSLLGSFRCCGPLGEPEGEPQG